MIYIIASTATSFPVDPSTATDIGVGVVASGNIGHITLDASDNIYIGDFSARIVRVDSGGTTAKDVVNIAGPTTCDSSQTGVSGNEPTFRTLGTPIHLSPRSLRRSWRTHPAPWTVRISMGPLGLRSGAGPTPTPTAMCRGVAATIVGTSGNDVIVGLQGNDIIYGGAGQDRICGGAGRDEIYGDDGDGTIFGGRGADVIVGGLGHDDIRGNRGNDVIFGGPGDDTLRGNKHGDTLFGGDGHDMLYGHLGSDYLYGEAGADELWGGQGDDVEYGGDGDDSLRCGPGTDYADGGPGIDTSGASCETQVDVP